MDTSFFTDDITNLSSALLKEDDPGDAGVWNKRTQAHSVCYSAGLVYSTPVNTATFKMSCSGCQSFPRVPRCLSETLFFCGVWAAGGLSGTLPGQGMCVCVLCFLHLVQFVWSASCCFTGLCAGLRNSPAHNHIKVGSSHFLESQTWYESSHLTLSKKGNLDL